MKQIVRVVIFIAASAAWLGGFTLADTGAAGAESTGCAAFNTLPTQNLSFVFSDDYDLNAGETIGAVVGTSFAGAQMSVEGTEVSTVPSSGGTLSYVVPATGNYNVEFRPIGEDTDADFDFFCIPAPANPCAGGPAPPGYFVLTGTQHDDTLIAGPYKTVILGLGGNDKLYGGANDDIICGGPGNDFIYGGAGNDYAEGGDGMDWVDGGSGNDKVYGNGDSDFVEGGAGDDFADGGTGRDRVGGGSGNDTGHDPDPGTRFVSIETVQNEG